jgi:predicted TIM-barrel fold metal-dependent hydrolase
LKSLVDAGFADRIMFGGDQMLWPEKITPAIESIEKAEFLTKEQKRDIFYNNAARFL